MFDFNQVGSLEDKTIIVTGANSGIGLEIAKRFSQKKAKVIIACRDKEGGLAVQRQIMGDSEYIHLDLGSFTSIGTFVESVKSKYSKVDVLVNNAGVMWPPLTKTTEGLELTFGTNYVGYFVLTNKIMPLLREVNGSRVVNMSSIAQYRVRNIDWDNINSEKHYSKTRSYNESNLFRIMFTIDLEDKLRQKGYKTIAIACHPGVTITNLIRFAPKFLGTSVFRRFMNNTIFHTPDKAAMPALMAATALNISGGDFIGLHSKGQRKGHPHIVSPNKLAFDKNLRQKLWDETVKITSVDLD